MAKAKNYYQKKIASLKPFLPRGSQKKILESVPNLKEWEVKKAFCGLLNNEDTLYLIFSEAFKIAKDTRKRRRQTDKKMVDLLGAKKAP